MAARDGRQELEAIAVVESIIQANQLTCHVNKELTPQPLILFRAGERSKFSAALRQCPQQVSQGGAIRHFDVQTAHAQPGAIRRIRHNLELHN